LSCQTAVTLVGIDCATRKEKVGLACGHYDQGQVSITEVAIGTALASVAETVAGWIRSAASCLLALDAPLGWPAALGSTLAHHRAGDPIHIPRDKMFRRLTDRVVERELEKRPLDVGADRIAHTAHAALYLLDELRYAAGRPIGLAWQLPLDAGIHALEVYPAATLLAHGMQAAGYKGARGTATRQEILRTLGELLALPDDTDLLVQHDHALDAVLCVLAGADFLRDEVVRPEDMPTAQQEGWIWFHRKMGAGKT